MQLNIGRSDDSFSQSTVSATGILQHTASPKLGLAGQWSVVVFALCTKRRKKWDLVLIVLEEDEMLPSSKWSLA